MSNPISESKRTLHSCKVEGNLLEYPLFYFDRATRRTKMSFVFEESIGDQDVRRKFSVENGSGLPGAIAQDCLVALMMIRERDGTRDVNFFVREIARCLDVEGRAARGHKREIVKKNLELLAKTIVEFKDSFFDKTKGEYVTTKIRPLFEKADLYEHRPGKNRREAWKENVFRLGELFERNLEAKYFNWIIFAKYKALKPGLARRLFLYLTKKSDGGRRREFAITLEKLYPRLPIVSRYPGHRFDILCRAAKDLEKVEITHRFTNTGLVTFFFPAKIQKILEAPRVDRKALEDLVVRFYRVIGTEQISAGRREDGVKVLIAVQAEAGVDVEKLGAIVDWVLARRETKFKGLHSIGILEKAWDQALSAITREEKKRAHADEEQTASRVAAAAFTEIENKRAQEIAELRSKVGARELAELRCEAERRFAQDRKYVFCGQDLAHVQDERERERRRERFLTTIEDALLRERAQPTSA